MQHRSNQLPWQHIVYEWNNIVIQYAWSCNGIRGPWLDEWHFGYCNVKVSAEFEEHPWWKRNDTTKNFIGDFTNWIWPMLEKIWHHKITSLVASKIATYLTSMVEREMWVWCLLTQVIATFTIVKTFDIRFDPLQVQN